MCWIRSFITVYRQVPIDHIDNNRRIRVRMCRFMRSWFLVMCVILTIWEISQLDISYDKRNTMDRINAIKRHVFGMDPMEAFNKHRNNIVHTLTRHLPVHEDNFDDPDDDEDDINEHFDMFNGEQDSRQDGADGGDDTYTEYIIQNRLNDKIENIILDITDNTDDMTNYEDDLSSMNLEIFNGIPDDFYDDDPIHRFH